MLWYIARVIDLSMYKPQGTLMNKENTRLSRLSKGPSLQNVKGKLTFVDFDQEREDYSMKHDEMQNIYALLLFCIHHMSRVLKFGELHEGN